MPPPAVYCDNIQSLKAIDDRQQQAQGQPLDLIACQTWIEETFTRPFTHSPAGELEPNGARAIWDLMSMFRFDDGGRLVEEFVRSDNRSFLRQLGAKVA